MKTQNIRLYAMILLISLTTFILQLFVFEAPDRTVGFLLCTASTLGMIFSAIQLYRYSSAFKNIVNVAVDLFL